MRHNRTLHDPEFGNRAISEIGVDAFKKLRSDMLDF